MLSFLWRNFCSRSLSFAKPTYSSRDCELEEFLTLWNSLAILQYVTQSDAKYDDCASIYQTELYTTPSHNSEMLFLPLQNKSRLRIFMFSKLCSWLLCFSQTLHTHNFTYKARNIPHYFRLNYSVFSFLCDKWLPFI